MRTEVLKSTTSFLTFLIGSGLYGINVSKIQNIIEVSRLSLFTEFSSFIIGVVNLRSNTIPVIDIRSRCGFTKDEFTDNTCIVVLELCERNKNILVGILIDSLNEVTEHNDDDIIEDNDGFYNINHPEVIQNFKLLNVEKLFSNNEIEQLLNYSN
jgi:purine-binding chemotaxis protein CheW